MHYITQLQANGHPYACGDRRAYNTQAVDKGSAQRQSNYIDGEVEPNWSTKEMTWYHKYLHHLPASNCNAKQLCRGNNYAKLIEKTMTLQSKVLSIDILS